MHDSKDFDWPANLGSDRDTGTSGTDHVEQPASQNGTDAWQQYRRWISKAPAPRPRRSGIDPALYTWKGYRNWTEQVKRNWTDSKDR